jgi:Tol biopolymer transport system component
VSSDDRRIEGVADAIVADEPVDWELVESAARPSERPLLAELKVLAEIARVHRGTLPPGAAEAGGPTDVEGPSIGAWGPLRLLERVGEGSFGEVYRAWDPRLEREVALKLLRHEDAERDEVASAVIEEGRLLARVRHPNVVTVYGADRIDGRVGVWMELIRGRTLERVLREQGPYSVQEATVIGVDLCRALSAVHRAGLLHRDVKAQNIMREEGGRIVLMDFGAGFAGVAGRDAPQLAGTPLYMAPEVLAGARATPRSDVYSLGVLLYHLVTEGFPVEGASFRSICERHERGERALLRDARPELPENFVRTVETALARSPEARFESAGAMEAALRDASAWSLPERAGARVGGRSWRRAMAGLLAVVAFGTFVGAYLLGRRTASQEATPVPRLHRLTDRAGLEESPALSPDGKSVAFTSFVGGRSQLFVQLVAGGPPLQLTRDAVDHQFPRWTPDSSGLVYYAPPAPDEPQGTLWEISALGGVQRRLEAAVGGADVAPDDRSVVFFRLASPAIELVALPRDGEATRVLTRLPARGYYLHPRCSPDGRWIAYQAGDGVRWDLYVISAAGGAPRRLTRDQTLIDGLDWLPDGKGLIFSSSRASTTPYLPTFGLWEVRLADGRMRELWTGDSSWVHPDVDASGSVVASRHRLQLDLWRFPVDGAPAENVRRGARITRQTGSVLTPTPSPGDAELAFLSDTGGHTNLWVIRTETGELRQITFERDPAVAIGVPLWAPDGRSIAFVSSRENPGLWFGLWLVAPDGSGLRQVVRRGLGAAWSPDSSWIYYVNLNSGRLEKVPASGGEPTPVSAERARNVIGVHGSTLYYTVERPLVDGSPTFEIRAADPETGPSRVLGRVPASRVANWQILNPALSSDGLWLAQALTDGPRTNIWALSTATGGWRQLTDFGDRATKIARRVSWSTDGQSVFAAVGDADADVVLLEGLVSPAGDRPRLSVGPP